MQVDPPSEHRASKKSSGAAAAKAGGKLAVAGGKTVARKLRDARHDGVR